MKRLWWSSAALLSLSVAAPAQHPTEHQWGGFVNAVWVEPRTEAGGPDEFSVWTAEDGTRIRRFDTWNGSETYESVDGSVNGTLHDIWIEDESPSGEIVDGIAVGSNGLALWRLFTTNWKAFAPGPADGGELWACFWDKTYWQAGQGTEFHERMWVAGTRPNPTTGVPEPTIRCASGIFSHGNAQWVDNSTPDVVADATFTAMDFADRNSASDPVAGIAANDRGQIFYTSDGMNWTLVDAGDITGVDYDANGVGFADRTSCDGFPGQFLDHPMIIWDIDFRPGSTVEAFAVGGLRIGNGPGFAFRTTDGGVTWTRVEPECCVQPTCPVPSLSNGPTDPCTGHPGQVGGTFEYQLFATFYGVQVFDNGMAMGVAYAGQVWKYLPTWGFMRDKANTLAQATGPIWGCHSDDDQQLWISGQFGVVRSSSNRGATWTAQTPDNVYRLEDIVFVDQDVGWVVGAGFRVMKTTDGGETWAVQRAYPSQPNLGRHLISIDAFDEDHLVAIGVPNNLSNDTAPTIIYTTDNSSNDCWTEVDLFSQIPELGTAGAPSSCIINPGDPPCPAVKLNIVAASGAQSAGLPEFWAAGEPWDDDQAVDKATLLRSTDGGASWTRVETNDLPTNFTAYGLDFINPSFAIIAGKVGTNKKAYYSTTMDESIPTWKEIPFDPSATGTAGSLHGVDLVGAGAVLVGTHGKAFFWEGLYQDEDPPYGDLPHSLVNLDGFAPGVSLKMNDVSVQSDGGTKYVFIVGDGAQLFRGTGPSLEDLTWDYVHPRTTDDLRYLSFVSHELGWFAGKQNLAEGWGDCAIVKYDDRP